MKDTTFLDFLKWYFSDPVLIGLFAIVLIVLGLFVAVLYYSRG